MTVQVTDQNTAQPSVFQLVSGPAGMTINQSTGVLSWTPTLANLGLASPQPEIAVYNGVGVTYLYPSIDVVFALEPTNITATGSLSSQSINVTWTDPTIALEPIAGYDIYLYWVDSTGNLVTSGPTFVPYGTYSSTLAATPGYTNFYVNVVAVDANGNEGAYPGSLIPVTLV
jgi:hypothetical protein